MDFDEAKSAQLALGHVYMYRLRLLASVDDVITLCPKLLSNFSLLLAIKLREAPVISCFFAFWFLFSKRPGSPGASCGCVALALENKGKKNSELEEIQREVVFFQSPL